MIWLESQNTRNVIVLNSQACNQATRFLRHNYNRAKYQLLTYFAQHLHILFYTNRNLSIFSQQQNEFCGHTVTAGRDCTVEYKNWNGWKKFKSGIVRIKVTERKEGVGRIRYQNPYFGNAVTNFGNAVTKLEFMKKNFSRKE